jgi:hypothetical protein
MLGQKSYSVTLSNTTTDTADTMINEHDIADWIHLDPVPLYSVEKKSFVKAFDSVFFFDHIDGMYSYCLDAEDNIVHLMATTLVTPLRKP